MQRRYRILHSKDMDDNRLPECRQLINNILTHPKGWIKYGVDFEDITDTLDKSADIIKVRFYNNDSMKKKYGGMNKLSAYDIVENAIYFNIDNWDNGGKDSFDSDPVTRYRTYVINHEFGHALGLDHVKPKNREGMRGSIMMQMTKGKEHIYPCELNEWPLEKEDFHEFDNGKSLPTRFSSKIMGGTYGQYPTVTTIRGNRGVMGIVRNNFCWIFILTLVLILILVTVCIKCNKDKYINNGSIYNHRELTPKEIYR